MKFVRPPRSWPPQCCVPAFIQAAFDELGFASPDDGTLARVLDVRVSPGQDNPFHLGLSTETDPAGLRAVDAERRINRLCRSRNTPIRFRHVPFKTIVFDLWEEVLRAAQEAGAVVGVGVDYHELEPIEPGRSALHVLRVVRCHPKAIELCDDSGESQPTCFVVDSDRFVRAVRAVPDGYWILGSEKSLSLPYTLPWSDLS